VETLLKSQDTTVSSKDATRQDSTSVYVANTINQALPKSGDSLSTAENTKAGIGESRSSRIVSFQDGATGNNTETIGLGLEEPLPPQKTIDDL